MIRAVLLWPWYKCFICAFSCTTRDRFTVIFGCWWRSSSFDPRRSLIPICWEKNSIDILNGKQRNMRTYGRWGGCWRVGVGGVLTCPGACESCGCCTPGWEGWTPPPQAPETQHGIRLVEHPLTSSTGEGAHKTSLHANPSISATSSNTFSAAHLPVHLVIKAVVIGGVAPERQPQNQSCGQNSDMDHNAGKERNK